MNTCPDYIHIEYIRLQRVFLGLLGLAKIFILSNVDVSWLLEQYNFCLQGKPPLVARPAQDLSQSESRLAEPFSVEYYEALQGAGSVSKWLLAIPQQIANVKDGSGQTYENYRVTVYGCHSFKVILRV